MSVLLASVYAYMCKPVACERQKKVLDPPEMNFCHVAMWLLGVQSPKIGFAVDFCHVDAGN